jgi:hypothetical protein
MTADQFNKASFDKETAVIYKGEVRIVVAVIFNRGRIGLHNHNRKNQTEWVNYQDCEM